MRPSVKLSRRATSPASASRKSTVTKPLEPLTAASRATIDFPSPLPPTKITRPCVINACSILAASVCRDMTAQGIGRSMLGISQLVSIAEKTAFSDYPPADTCKSGTELQHCIDRLPRHEKLRGGVDRGIELGARKDTVCRILRHARLQGVVYQHIRKTPGFRGRQTEFVSAQNYQPLFQLAHNPHEVWLPTIPMDVLKKITPKLCVIPGLNKGDHFSGKSVACEHGAKRRYIGTRCCLAPINEAGFTRRTVDALLLSSYCRGRKISKLNVAITVACNERYVSCDKIANSSGVKSDRSQSLRCPLPAPR